jgi:hypothetical protein
MPSLIRNPHLALVKEASGHTQDFYAKVAQGEIPQYGYVRKFGHNPAPANGVVETVWDGSNYYPFPASNLSSGVVTVESDVAADSFSGVGMREVKIFGLLYSAGADDWTIASETVTMSGTSAITLENQYRRIYRAYNTLVGTFGTNSGTVSIKHNGTDIALIEPSKGQTLMAVFTIPVGYKGSLIKWRSDVVADDNTQVKVAAFDLKTCIRQVSGNLDGGLRVRDLAGLKDTWTVHPLPFPIQFEEKTDIWIDVTAKSNSTVVTAGFDILLEKASED